MAHKSRAESQGAFYHAIARGNQRQRIFLEDEDHRQYVNRLILYQKRYLFTLYAYVLMPNHVHLLIGQGENPLSKIMQGVSRVIPFTTTGNIRRQVIFFRIDIKRYLGKNDFIEKVEEQL